MNDPTPLPADVVAPGAPPAAPTPATELARRGRRPQASGKFAAAAPTGRGT